MNKEYRDFEPDQPVEHKLKVSNIPPLIKKDNLDRLFAPYGKVLKIKAVRGADNYFAHVTYSKYEEAEAAIKGLSENKLFNLTVQFVKKAPVERAIPNINQNVTVQTIDYDFRDQDVSCEAVPASKNSIELGRPAGLASFQNQEYTIMDNLLYPVPVDNRIFNPYEIAKSYRATSVLFIRDDYKSDKGRFVHKGRGYTYYDIPRQNSQMNGDFENGVFRFGKDILKDRIRECKECKTFTGSKCSKCDTYYCSVKCQIRDWPKHKSICGIQLNAGKRKNKVLLLEKLFANSLSLDHANDSIWDQSNQNKMPKVFDFSTVGSKGNILLYSEIKNNTFVASVIPNELLENFEYLLCECRKELDNMIPDPSTIYKIGDLVWAKHIGGEWYRGYVVRVIPMLMVAVIDEGAVIIPCSVLPMPDKFKKMCTYGVVCKFQNTEKKICKDYDALEYRVLECQKDFMKIQIHTIVNNKKKFFSNGEVSTWSPLPEQMGVPSLNLKNQMEVAISSFINQDIIYVRSLDPEEAEKSNILNQKLALYALTEKKKLADIPVVGQLVMVQYKDKNYCRAVVTKIDGEKVIIKYIDYGNEETTTIDKLYTLSDTLKKYASQVVRVSLADVPKDVPLTHDAVQYLINLTGEPAILKCTFKGSTAKDGIFLRMLNNESVNKKLDDFLTPTYEKVNPRKTTDYFMINDLESFKLGEVGSTIEGIVLGYFSGRGLFFVCPKDEYAIIHCQEVIKEMANKYANTVKDHYLPRDNELCIAKYKDNFYRGECLISTASSTTSRILFSDFGVVDIVKHEDIRLMTKDFMYPPRLATWCTMDMIPEDEKEMPKIIKIVEDHIPINIPVEIKIIKIDEDFVHVIDIPKVKQILKEKRLI